MIVFQDIQDVSDWLEPLNYVSFWEAVAPYDLFPAGDRGHCDQTVSTGIAPQETVLFCLKVMARIALTERFGLRHRMYEPVDAQYLRTTH